MEGTLFSYAIDYLKEVKSAVSEAHKRDLFAQFIRNLYGKKHDIRVEDSVEFKGVYAGRVDLSVDGVLFEFKKDISSRSAKRKALEELEKYLSSDQYKTSPFGIITDGIRFEVYERENLKAPIDIFSFPENEEDTKAIEKVLYRLDRYLLIPQKLPLTSERVIDVLGYNSSFFRSVHRRLLELFEKVKDDRNTKLKLSEWKIYMSFVYGKELEEELFFRHTYLSIVVKILAVKLLGLEASQNILEILSGELFRRAGIQNYIEKDFFSWILHKSIEEEIKELGELVDYTISTKFEIKDLSDELEEDILKELYQNIVSKNERKLLGEYYTPDWLVQRILEEVLKDPSLKVLDPSCGSGSFLFFTIKKKKQQYFKNPQEKLEHILDTVVGIDVNPLAVLVAKTNYLIALGELLREREKDIYIPVYSADSLLAFLEESQRQLFGESVKVKVNDIIVELPKHKDIDLIDRFIDLAVEYALEHSGRGNFYNFLAKNYPQEEEEILKLEKGSVFLHKTAESIKQLVEEKGDGIWTFIFKNIYKPLFLKENFDLVVGNPPWLVFNRMHKAMQGFVEEFLENHGITVEGHNKLNIDLAFIFLISCFLNYLKNDGTIAFVLPYSLLSGDQNSWFRKRNYYKGRSLEMLKIYDLKDVEPLFNVPSCVLIGKKIFGLRKLKKEIPAVKFEGKLPKANASLGEAQKHLNEEERTLYLVELKNKNYWVYNPSECVENVYTDMFSKGADIIPRSFWFVEREKSPLGYSKTSVPIVSKDTGDEKLKVILKGSAPEKFFFKTPLSKRMYPFGFTHLDEVVLPLEVVSSSEEAVEDVEESLNRVREFIREYEEGIDETADADAYGVLLNLLCFVNEYIESNEVSVEAKRRIVELLWENRDLIEYLGIGGKEGDPYWWWRGAEYISKGGFDIYEPIKDIGDIKLKERFRYRLLDYYEITKTQEFKDASERFKYWLDNTKKVPKNFKEWLIKCQRTWEEWRGEKAKSHNIVDWLNYRNKLTSQPVKGGYLVLYTAHGSNPCACVVENDERIVVDHMTFYAYFKTVEEALYVASFINSSVLHNRIREQQASGLFGERHIHKLIVQQPIPKYDPRNELHKKLVKVAKRAVQKANKEAVKEYLKDAHPNRIRTEGRTILEFELNQIDQLVAKILGEKEPPPLNRLCLFVKTDMDSKKFASKLKKLLKEKNLETSFRLLPLEIAIVKYEREDISEKDYTLAVEFTENLEEVEEKIEEVLKNLVSAGSLTRKGG